MSLCCPLCTASVEPPALEAHLRHDLRLPLLSCLLCPQSFCDEEEAEDHFQGPFAKHPAAQPQLIRPPADPAKKARLLELLRLAAGGPEAVQQRLCVCGRCRLLCREDFRPTSGPPSEADFRPAPLSASRPLDLRVKGSPDSAIQLSGGRPRQYRDEETPDPAFRFATDLGPLKPSKLFPPTSDSWSAPAESEELDEQRYQEEEEEPYDQESWRPSDQEAPVAMEQRPSPKPPSAGRKTKSKAAPAGAKSSQSPPASKDSVQCGSCAAPVRRRNVKEHATRVHLRKPLYKCRSCDFAVTDSNGGRINTHVKRAHGQTPGPETVDSGGLRRYEETIKEMIRELFG